jgi:hypothetical protein
MTSAVKKHKESPERYSKPIEVEKLFPPPPEENVGKIIPK